VQEVAFEAVAPDGSRTVARRAVAEELPVAIEVCGLGYAVLMATGTALEDLAWGFALSERLVDRADQIEDVDVHALETGGAIVRIALTPDCAGRVRDRLRHRTSDSSCGLCGIENLEQAMRPLPRVPEQPPVATAAVFHAIGLLREHQPLGRATGASHAAAFCDRYGAIRLVREDVGRHNAFDKLIGAMQRGGLGWDGGFALLSSRCSYELVEKAVLSGCGTLVTVSAPTSLAVERAQEAGLRLIVLARPDALLRLPDYA
jgi:FdhD protein